MCEFHDCNCNGLGDTWWTDKCTYFSSIDYTCRIYFIELSLSKSSGVLDRLHIYPCVGYFTSPGIDIR